MKPLHTRPESWTLTSKLWTVWLMLHCISLLAVDRVNEFVLVAGYCAMPALGATLTFYAHSEFFRL
jgi:hypothetical protein